MQESSTAATSGGGIGRAGADTPEIPYQSGNICTAQLTLVQARATLVDLRPSRDHPMSDSLGRRIFLAHLELSYRLGRKVTLAEFGELIARRMARKAPFTAAAVSRWESGIQIPTPQIIEAIAALTHTDPGWISHGRKSAAPRPGRLEKPAALPAHPSHGTNSAPPPLSASAAQPKSRVSRRRT